MRVIDMTGRRSQGGWLATFEADGVRFNASLIRDRAYGRFVDDADGDHVEHVEYTRVEVAIWHGVGIDETFYGEECDYGVSFLTRCVEEFIPRAHEVLEAEAESESERMERLGAEVEEMSWMEQQEMLEYEVYWLILGGIICVLFSARGSELILGGL